MQLKTAIIQQAPIFLNLTESIELAGKLISDSKNNGANIVIFPETWFPGYPLWFDHAPGAVLWDSKAGKALFRILYQNSIEVDDINYLTLHKFAKENAVYLCIGMNEKRAGTIYNTLALIDNSGDPYKTKIHRKLVPTFTERLVWGRGDGSTLNVMTTEYGNIGGLICWEHWMPLARSHMHDLGEILHISQWPAAKEMHQIAARHYAFEGGCFVAAAGTFIMKSDVISGFDSLHTDEHEAGKLLESIEKDVLMDGGSSLIAPDGAYVINPVHENEKIIYAEFDTDRALEAKYELDTAGHYSRPDIFQLSVNKKVKF